MQMHYFFLFFIHRDRPSQGPPLFSSHPNYFTRQGVWTLVTWPYLLLQGMYLLVTNRSPDRVQNAHSGARGRQRLDQRQLYLGGLLGQQSAELQLPMTFVVVNFFQ